MKNTLPTLALAAAVGLLVTGCQKQEDTTVSAPRVDAASSTPSGSSNPQIMPSGAGGNAPVLNPQAVEGAGSGVGSVAKDRARAAAGKASAAGSAQPGSEGE